MAILLSAHRLPSFWPPPNSMRHKETVGTRVEFIWPVPTELIKICLYALVILWSKKCLCSHKTRSNDLHKHLGWKHLKVQVTIFTAALEEEQITLEKQWEIIVYCNFSCPRYASQGSYRSAAGVSSLCGICVSGVNWPGVTPLWPHLGNTLFRCEYLLYNVHNSVNIR